MPAKGNLLVFSLAVMRFTKDHLWFKFNVETHKGECGISFYAQKSLGKVKSINLPEAGKKVRQEDDFGKVESVSCILNLNSPIDFTVTQVRSEDKRRNH